MLIVSLKIVYYKKLGNPFNVQKSQLNAMKNLELSHSCVILVTLAVNFCWKKSILQQSRLGAGKEKYSVCSLYPFYRRITLAMTTHRVKLKTGHLCRRFLAAWCILRLKNNTQWSPDFFKPGVFEPPDNSNQTLFPSLQSNTTILHPRSLTTRCRFKPLFSSLMEVQKLGNPL